MGTVISFDAIRAMREVDLSLADFNRLVDQELRFIEASTAAKRQRIDGLLARINDDVEHLRPSDSGTP